MKITLSVTDLCLLAIAVALWCYLFFGIDWIS